MRITLTQDGNGLPVEIDPAIIVAISPLGSSAAEHDHHPRTAVTGLIGKACHGWVVQESLEQIHTAIAEAGE